MANTYHSRKAKGNRLEKWVADEYIRRGIDEKAHKQIMSGGGYLKGDINTTHDTLVECKNQENWSISKWWAQLMGEMVPGKRPVLVISRNNDEKYAFMYAKHWLDLEQINIEQQKKIIELEQKLLAQDNKPNGYLERPRDNRTNVYMVDKAIEALKQVKRHLCE